MGYGWIRTLEKNSFWDFIIWNASMLLARGTRCEMSGARLRVREAMASSVVRQSSSLPAAGVVAVPRAEQGHFATHQLGDQRGGHRHVAAGVAQEDHAAAAARGFHGCQQRRGHAGGVDGDVGAAAGGEFFDLLDGIVLAAVDRQRETELAGEIEFLRDQVEERHLGGAHGAGPLGDHQADGTGPEDGDGLAEETGTRALQRVQRDGRRLGHGGFFQRDAGGNAQKVLPRGGEVLGKRAIAAGAEIVVVVALHVLAVLAGGALAAPEQREDRHPVTGGKVSDSIAHAFDGAGELMAADRGELIGALGEDARDIRTADPPQKPMRMRAQPGGTSGTATASRRRSPTA